ncbi:MAG: ASCH domain-containing protein [Cyanobacteria bacterium P01_H01_bin.121]
MKSLTLWQPWASLIAIGLKHYETRSWGTKYRGLIAIHAAKRKPTLNECELWGDALECANLDPALPGLAIEQQPLGKFVAIARLTDCFQMQDDGDQPSDLEDLLGHWETGRFAWKLNSVIDIRHRGIAHRGAQGLQTLTDHATLLSLAGAA